MKATEMEIRRFAEEHSEVLHHRPWRKRPDGVEWFFGASGLRHGGDSPAYRVFEFSKEQAQLFDEACFQMKAAGELIYMGPALEDKGAIYGFHKGG